MAHRKINTTDKHSGEITDQEFSDGVLVYLPRKKTSELYGTGFFMASQSALEIIATDKEITLETRRVLDIFVSKLDFDNYIYLSQKYVAEKLEMQRSNVSRAVALLARKKIILKGPKVGRTNTWRLNPNFGYKGDSRGKVRVDRGGHLHLIAGTEIDQKALEKAGQQRLFKEEE